MIDPMKKTVFRYTLIGSFVNSFLFFFQLIAGWLFHSPAVVADALHTLTDLLSDIVILLASKKSQAPPNRKYPYGHGKFENLAEMLVALFMIGAGVAFAIKTYQALLAPVLASFYAIPVALATLIAKETLYQFTARAGRRLGSRLLITNAWHHRTDAISSLAVFISLIAARFGYPFLDPLAGFIIAAAIVFTGFRFAQNSLRDLLESGIDDDFLEAILETARAQSGVEDVLEFRARRHGSDILMDLHVLVNGRISVSDGHQIAIRVMQGVKEKFPRVSDVLVHIDPEDDEAVPTPLQRSSFDLENEVRENLKNLEGLEGISHFVVHFLEGKASVQFEILVDKNLSLEEASGIARKARKIVEATDDIHHADIHLELNDEPCREDKELRAKT
jgi:cation diffusion facilitator family transporter